MLHNAEGQPSAWNLLLALCFCMTTYVLGTQLPCNPEGPENCGFSESSENVKIFCSWVCNGGFVRQQGETGPLYVELSDEGNLTSREVCVRGKWKHNCLKFSYRFDLNDTIDLSVGVQYYGYSKAEPPIWKLSSSPHGWNQARVPISTNGNFYVVFKARRRTPDAGRDSTSNAIPQKKSVYIGSVEYETGDTCKLEPQIASPKTAPEEEEEEGEEDDNGEQGDVVVVAGAAGAAAAAVVVIVVAVAVVLLVFRRRKSCPRNGDGSEHSPSSPQPHSDATCGIGGDEPGNDTNGAMAAVPASMQISDNSHLPARLARTLEAAKSSDVPPVCDYYSTADSHPPAKTSSESPALLYSLPCKGRRADQPPCFQPARIDRTPAGGLSPLSHDHNSRQSDYGYETVVEVRRGGEEMATKGAGKGSTSDKEGPGCYDMLDFSGSSRAAARAVAAKIPGASETIYNHLGDGSGDTYSGLDQDGTKKRVVVIDSEYSHLQ